MLWRYFSAFLGDEPGIAVIHFARDRIDHIPDEGSVWARSKRDPWGGCRVRHPHVAVVDRSPSESMNHQSGSVLEQALGQLTDRNRKMLPGADQGPRTSCVHDLDLILLCKI